MSSDDRMANLVGLTVGPLALGALTMTQSLAALLAWPPELQAAVRTGGLATGPVDPSRLRAVFYELARLHPPAPAMVRRAERRVNVATPEFPPLRARGTFLVLVEAAMLDPRVHPDPTRFVPERFLDTPGPHLAFGAGMHACMGTDAYGALVPRILGPLFARPVRAVPVDGRSASGFVAQEPPFPTASKGAKASWSFPARLPVELR